MSERRYNIVSLLCVALLIAAALVIYDRFTRNQRDAVVERQLAIADRTAEEVIGLNHRAEQLREQLEAAETRKLELEIKRLELEIKRADADRETALARQKEIDAGEADKKRAADKAGQAEETARMDAESRREQEKRDSVHQKAAAIKSALHDRADAARKLNDLAWRKQAAQRAVIAWKNKLEGARNSKTRSQNELANAQATPSNRAAVESAQTQIAGADKALAEAEAALKKAQDEFDAVSNDYDSAQTSLQNADQRLSLVAPAPDKSRIYATYALTDGRRLDALCVIESGEDIWIRTSTGVKSFKRSDVEEVTKE